MLVAEVTRAGNADVDVAFAHIHLRQRQRDLTNLTKVHKLFSALNLSHASFKVANTAALIIFCSVVAVVGS